MHIHTEPLPKASGILNQQDMLEFAALKLYNKYLQISNIRRTLVGDNLAIPQM